MLEEESYHEYLQNWINDSDIFVNSLSKEEETLVIAMSRKMPRLLKWIIQKEKLSLAKHVTIITEHAIPFCVDELKKKRIIVIDDAIYYGTTIENVVENIAWCTGRNDIAIAPIIKRKDTREFQYGSLSVKNELSEEDIPFYTTHNAANIMSLGIPMDMEYPILSFKRNKHEFSSIQNMKRYLEGAFTGKETYSIEHQIYDKRQRKYTNFISFSILLDSQKRNADFSKLRLYILENEVQIVAYSPFVISEKQLEQHPKSIKFETALNDIWNILFTKAQSYEKGIDNLTNPAQKDIMQTEYKYRQQRSLVVSANYLESFRTLLQHKNKIEQFLENAGFSKNPNINIQDLKFLFGNELCKSIQEKLLYAWDNIKYTTENESFNTILTQQVVNLIPADFKASYTEQNRIVWNNLSDTSTALSGMFSNLHFHIGLNSLKNMNFDKLRFGESFASMDFELAPFIKVNNRLKEIHKWIDQKIDEGCVAPKYELVNIGGERCWKRLFRAGENENDWIKIARIAFYTIERMTKSFKSKAIERKYLDEILAIILTDPFKEINYNYLFAPFKTKWQDNIWQLFIENEDTRQDIAVIPTLKAFTFLQSETIGTLEYLNKQDNILNAQFGTALPLNKQQSAWVDAYIDLYVAFIQSHSLVLASHFFLQQEDITPVYLNEWLRKVSAFFNDDWKTPSSFTEEQNNSLNTLTAEISSLYFKRMTLDKEQIETLTEEEHTTEEYQQLKQHIMNNPVLNQNAETQQDILKVLFYWEAFIAIFKENDIDYAKYSINILVDVIKEDVSKDIRDIINNGISKQQKTRNILRYDFHKAFNTLIQQ